MTKLEVSNLKKYSWDEVKLHNKDTDAWVVIEKLVGEERKGLVLDITQWAHKHPGGPIIYDGAGGDCSVLFWTYHPLSFIDNSNSYFNKFVIGEIENYKGLYKVDSEFYRTLKHRVETKISRKDRREDIIMYLKSIFILVGSVFGFKYGWLTGNLPMIVVYSLFVSGAIVNIMHDGVHYSYARNSYLNTIAGFVFDLVGYNYVSYRRAHVFSHHVYTNHDEYDRSLLRSWPILQFHDKLNGKWHHKLQHHFMHLVYLFGIFPFWTVDALQPEDMLNYPRRKGPLTNLDFAVRILGKLLFVLLNFVIPFYLFEPQKVLINILTFYTTMGAITVVLFAVNHWTDKVVLVTDKELLSTETDWATMQVLTSCNFSVNSQFMTHWAGGLNLQIEHHLFPGMIHTRLSTATPIIRETCKEFGIDYDNQCYDSLWGALVGNFNFAKNIALQKWKQPPTFSIIEGKNKHA